jgi:outer membrane immunogenic protein
MRSKIVSLLAVAFSLGFAQAASAADMPVKAVRAPIAVPAYNWTGWYVGINGGYGWNTRTGDSLCTTPGGVVLGPGCDAPNNGIVRPAGGLFGAQLGYNFQSGSIIYGIETDFQWSGIKDSQSVTDFFPGGVPTGGIYSASANLQWFGTLRGRVGFTAFDRGLLYATGGLFYGHESTSAVLTFPATTYPQSGSTTRAGWTLGAGFEYGFSQNLSAKIEGLYYDMGKQTISVVNPATLFTEATTFAFRGGIVRAGLNWKFM